MTFNPHTEHLLQFFILTAGVLLIPVLIGLMVVVLQLAFLIHSTSEFVRFATGELLPVIRDVRLMMGNLNDVSLRVTSGIQEASQTLQQTGPLLKQGATQLQKRALAFFSGLQSTFSRSKAVTHETEV